MKSLMASALAVQSGDIILEVTNGGSYYVTDDAIYEFVDKSIFEVTFDVI